MGTTPAVGPTANRGHEMAARQGIGAVIKALERILPMVGSETEIGQEVMKSLKGLGKFSGGSDPQAEKNELQQAFLRNAEQGRMAQMMQQQRAAGGGPGGGAGAGGPPGAGPMPPPGAA